MREPAQPRGRIRARLVWSFSLLSLLIIVVFSMFNMLFVYAVEDTFFQRLVEDERAYMQSVYEAEDVLPVPRQSSIEVVAAPAQLPEDIRVEFAREPDRPEYAGSEGRHYHLAYSDDPPFILVAEVSEYLVVREFRTAIFTLLAGAALILMLLAVLVALVLGNRLARPVESLARLFSTARASALPTRFADDYPPNEIGQLARGMEQAMARINAFIAREQDFTRDVSHELRTPVAVMSGALEVLEAQDNAGQSALLNRMRSAVQMMEQNIETLLVIAREDTALASPATRLLPVVERVIIANASLLEDKLVEVAVPIAQDFTVRAPEARLQILLNNLISNAFRHTDKGVVTLSTEGDSTLVVSDSGTGIDPMLEGQVFSDYVKGEHSAGLGVGLSIVRRLCEHQGWIIAMSSSGEGTRITVSF